MRIRATAALATVLLCTASAGSAQTAAAETLPIVGAGAVSCGKWLAHRHDDGLVPENLHFSELQWFLGWLSAASQYNVRVDLRDTDPDAVTSWVDKYCREHPLNRLHEAAAALVFELSKPE